MTYILAESAFSQVENKDWPWQSHLHCENLFQNKTTQWRKIMTLQIKRNMCNENYFVKKINFNEQELTVRLISCRQVDCHWGIYISKLYFSNYEVLYNSSLFASYLLSFMISKTFVTQFVQVLIWIIFFSQRKFSWETMILSIAVSNWEPWDMIRS